VTTSGGLRRFVRGAPAAPAAAPAPPQGRQAAAERRQAGESCEMCAAEIPADHGHVADLERSALLCTCRACYLLFTHSQAGRARYRAVPDRWLADPAHPVSAAEWDQLQIPVGLAFFLVDSRRGGIAGFYPSPAGVTECQLDLAAWDRLAADHPLLQAMEPDVESALICKAGETVEHFLVPVDACYELAGRMRLLWQGFDGGAEAHASMNEFLDRVRSRARPVT
jgi:Family of unknown function (DUF5947)